MNQKTRSIERCRLQFGDVLDVLDGALDDATWNGSAINS